MVDDDFEMNDASTTIEQVLQLEAVCDSVEVDIADKTTDAYGHASTDSDDRIDVENIANDDGRYLMIQDGLEMDDASTIIGQEYQVDNVTRKQTNTVMDDSSKNVGEQTIIQGGLKDMEQLLTMVEKTEIDILFGFDNARNEESNPEEVENDDGRIGYESISPSCNSSDTSVKVSTIHVKKTSKKNFTIPFDQDFDEGDSASESDGPKSSSSHFSQTAIDQPSKGQQSESKL